MKHLLRISMACLALCLASVSMNAKRIPVILDTDSNNELDDQHAIAYMLMSPESFKVKGITTNATHAGGQIENHTLEAERVIALCGKYGRGIKVRSGANGKYEDILPELGNKTYDGCEAVDFIIKTASRYSPKKKLTIVAVGKLTNVALAIKKAPQIIPNIRLVWLGSNYPKKGEYNLMDDIPSMNAVLETNIEMEIAPVRGREPSGTWAVRLMKDEAINMMRGKGPQVSPVEGRHGGDFSCFGDYSVSLFEHIKLSSGGRSLFDMAAVAIVKNPNWATKRTIPAPIMTDEEWVDRPDNERVVSLWENFDKDAIIADFLSTIGK